ncbi:RecQ family ATP-dependent DNA helicase [Rhizobium leguminosarum]|uniref:RecQ family ATP-dependent DNA helicase n=1 Tax=Rhizobium TaxID=379 RepID=UPI00103E7014|nr:MULTISPECIES: RecQ family ATP-dependent DNA helicase [Rhizobium]NEJ85355.1 RecQ family ATP-dependent DNA helicase [Rhizobium ruizarguesonis]TCA58077.1 ATP-dependent DNA helicase RecQ [Rhizobium leguminosarum bv. viciae]
MTTTAVQALAKWFPEITAFRDRQESVVARLLGDQSALLLMPTGAGKTLTYQLPVLEKSGISLVISPLIALMREQAEKLTNRGIAAIALGGLEPAEAQAVLARFPWESDAGFLFTSPERLETDGFLEYMLSVRRQRIVQVTIDEVHCISQWGHDFRPAYKALPRFLDRVFGPSGWPPRLCLTATLDPPSEEEVRTDFRLQPSDVVRSDHMLRANLDLSYETYDHTDTKLAALDDLLEEHRGEKIIVYAHLKQNKRGGTRTIAERLRAKGHKAEAFDADLPLSERDRVAGSFKCGESLIVCATGAFGMGIDIPDIRGVVHLIPPESFEQYYQEVGRAGRDGKPAFAKFLYFSKNGEVRREMIEAGLTTSEAVMQSWSDLMDSCGRNDLKLIDPQMAFDGKDYNYALFHAFQRLGAIDVVARGPMRLDVYEPKGPDGLQLINRLRANTKTGNFLAAFRKLSLDPADGYRQVFELQLSGQLKLVRSPGNCLIFRTKDLTNVQADQIATDINRKIENRLKEFDSFRAVMETGKDIEEVLARKFASLS